MAKINKVLAIYDAQGNRQAIPLYSSLEDVKNLGRKIYYSPTEFAYYPLTEKLDDPNASKKVVVIGTKTYKALLKVSSGFKTILEALDIEGYITAENSHKLDDIDRTTGAPVYIHSDANLDDYDFSSMYSNGTRVEMVPYDTTNPKYINNIDLTPYNNLIMSAGMTYSIPTKNIKYNNIKNDGSLEAVMATPYIGDRTFKGILMKNTYGKSVFTGKYNDVIPRIIEDIAQSPLATNTYISGSSNKVEKITLGYRELDEVKIDPFDFTARNVMQITSCKIKETDKWQFAFLVYYGNKTDNTYNIITPYTETEAQTKESLRYICKLSKNDIKDDVNIKSCNNQFGTIVILTRPASYGTGAGGALNAVKKIETGIIILDTEDTEIFRKDIVVYSPLKAVIDKDYYMRNYVNAPYYNTSGKINIWIDYDSDFKDDDNFYVKLLFGNDIIHTIQIYQDYIPSVSVKNILSTVQSKKYLSSNSCNNVESVYANLAPGNRYINKTAYKYKGSVGIRFDIENITDFKKNPIKSEDLEELNKKRTLAIYTSDLDANKNLNTNKDLFLFNMLNIMNQPGYTGAKDCAFIQQTIMAPESQLESVMNTKANADISNISYYPLRLNEI